MRETEEKPGKEAMRLRSERSEGPFPRREHSTTCHDSLACGEAEEHGKGFWDAEEFDSDQALGWRTRIASQALFPRESNVAPVAHEKAEARAFLAEPCWQVLGARQPVDCARAACIPVDAASDSSHARAGEPTQLLGGAAARSPGGALSSLSHATDTARAADRSDNHSSWRRRAPAVCHRARGAARSGAVTCPPHSAAFRPALAQSPAQRTVRLSRARPPRGQRSPSRELCALSPARW